MDGSGRGLALIWRRQIQQLNRVSSEMASAIVDAYPSPQLLVQVSCYGWPCPPDILEDSIIEGPRIYKQCGLASLRKDRFSCLNLTFLPSYPISNILTKGWPWVVWY